MDKPETILHTKNLSVGYKDKKANNLLLTALNLHAGKGELICLLGENGVGKSSLLRTLANLQKPLEGVVSVHGQPLTHYSYKQLAQKIAIVLTHSIQGANLNVQELVAMGRYPYTGWTGRMTTADENKVLDAITTCGLNDLKDKNIHQISDGQLQKALIARALAQDCPLMLLDEPTVHLDANNQHIIMQLLREISSETGKCIILSTHQINQAIDMADVLWLATVEKTVIVDSPQQLLEKGILQSLFPFVKY